MATADPLNCDEDDVLVRAVGKAEGPSVHSTGVVESGEIAYVVRQLADQERHQVQVQENVQKLLVFSKRLSLKLKQKNYAKKQGAKWK